MQLLLLQRKQQTTLRFGSTIRPPKASHRETLPPLRPASQKISGSVNRLTPRPPQPQMLSRTTVLKKSQSLLPASTVFGSMRLPSPNQSHHQLVSESRGYHQTRSLLKDYRRSKSHKISLRKARRESTRTRSSRKANAPKLSILLCLAAAQSNQAQYF